jgi:uncharacterized tellurite resistance protein B-like protein
MKLSDILSAFRQGDHSVRSHMKNLIEVAAVDGQFLDVEMDLLKKIAKRNGISEQQLKEIRNNPASVKFELPSSDKARFMQLYDLVHMMSVDHEVHEEEWKLCNLYAVKFGYDRTKVNELIESVKSNIMNNQTVDETMKRVGWLLA